MKPEQLAADVCDEATFLRFVKALERDFSAGASGWENGTIESFLEAGTGWAEDSKFGESTGVGTSNPWRKFAHFLLAGKAYE